MQLDTHTYARQGHINIYIYIYIYIYVHNGTTLEYKIVR